MKVKILVFGPIGNQVDAFVKKIRALHESKAGPFDAAFSIGAVANLANLKEANLPIPLYLQEADFNESEIDSEADSSQPITLAENLYLLQKPDKAGGVWSLSVKPEKPEIIVCSVPSHLRIEKAKGLMETLQHVSYTGSDLLLSSEWPQGVEKAFNVSPDNPPVSYDVADVALKARARYHFAPGSSFAQSQPFTHLAATTNTVKPKHVGRFLALHPVETDIKDKQKQKFVHALGFNPLHHMTAVELNEQKDTIQCPFTDDSYGENENTTGKHVGNIGLSDASARRILAEEQGAHGEAAGRWAGKRRRDGESSEIDPTSKTLFVHGIHKDVSGRLQSGQGNEEIKSSLPGAIEVRFPPSTSAGTFCFVEFESHDDAMNAWRMTGGEISVNGVRLTVKWAPTRKPPQESTKRRRLTEAEAKDSTVLFYKLPRGATNFEEAAEDLRIIAERTLEEALSDGENVITAEEEPALRVQVRSKEEYGFLDFASHAAASMVLASLTGSTDGGKGIVEGTKLTPKFYDLLLYWSEHKKTDQIVDNTTGFKFDRKHFPTDSRKDCWFCLASESCEKHLITGVYQTCYSAMPKGPIHEAHVLLIPVQHSSDGALKDPGLSREMEVLKKKVCEYFQRRYNMDAFIFERAIQTKGGYHTHIQCIPIEKSLTPRVGATLLGQAKQARMSLREITSDLSIFDVLDDDRDGYFYAEICTEGEKKRFIHSSDRNTCPLQFGREVVAAVLGKPELAHWKSTDTSKAEETRMAAALRKGLSHLNNDEN